MIILDTNVVSEPLRPAPTEAVISWLDSQAVETLYLTTITLAELRYRIAALPDGRRQQRLRDRLEDEFLPLFEGRVLSFDEPASLAYGELRARTRTEGRAMGDRDALIAAVALAHGFCVATRDTAPFLAAGVTVIDPFSRS